MRTVIYPLTLESGKPVRPFEGEYSQDDMFTISGSMISLYVGEATEEELPTFSYDTPRFTARITGVEVLNEGGAIHSQNERECTVLLGTTVKITALNDGPHGTWSTPYQSPLKIGRVTTTKEEGSDIMEMTITFGEDGDWHFTNELINSELVGMIIDFTDYRFVVARDT